MFTISTDPNWSWANNAVVLAQIRGKRDDLEAFKASSTFWTEAFLQRQFSAFAKKTYEPSKIDEEAAKTIQLSKIVKALTHENERMQRMHREAIKTDAEG